MFNLVTEMLKKKNQILRNYVHGAACIEEQTFKITIV